MDAELKLKKTERSQLQRTVRSLITRIRAVIGENNPARTRQCEVLSASLLDHQNKHDGLLAAIVQLSETAGASTKEVEDKGIKLKAETSEAYKEATEWIVQMKSSFGVDITSTEDPAATGAGVGGPMKSGAMPGPGLGLEPSTDKDRIKFLERELDRYKKVEDDLEDARYEITTLKDTTIQQDESASQQRAQYEDMVKSLQTKVSDAQRAGNDLSRELDDEKHRSKTLEDKLTQAEADIAHRMSFAPHGESTRASFGGSDLMNFSQVIAQSNAAVFKQMLDQSNIQHKTFFDSMQTPRVELKTFSGDLTEYHAFLSRFNDVVGDTQASYGVKLNNLIQACSDDVRRQLDCCNYKPSKEGYELALTILKTRYGNPFLVSQAWVEKMLGYGALVKPDEIMKFASDLQSCYHSLKSLGYVADLENTANMQKVVSKLPNFVQNRWRKTNRDKIKAGSRPALTDLIDIINDAAEELADPIYGPATMKKVGGVVELKPGAVKPPFRRRVMAAGQVEYAEPEPAMAAGGGPGPAADVRRPVRKIRCAFCQEEHYPRTCPTYVSLSPADKLKLVYEKKLCILCLNTSHVVADCKMTWTCQKEGCTRRHNTTLHDSFDSAGRGQQAATGSSPALIVTDITDATDDSSEMVSAMMGGVTGESYSVPVVPVSCQGYQREMETNALIDTGASMTFMRRSFYNQLKLEPYARDTFTMTSLTSTVTFTSDLVNLDIRAADSTEWKTAYAVVVVDDIPVSSNYSDRMRYIDQWPHLQQINMRLPRTESIDILIGQSNAKLWKQTDIVEGRTEDEPFAVRTHLGWLLMGHYVKLPQVIKPLYKYKYPACVNTCVDLPGDEGEDEDLHRKLELFWQGEEVPDVKHENPVNAAIVRLWEKETTLVDGHLQIPIPVKNDPPNMPENRESVMKRFQSLTRRLLKDDDLRAKYQKSMNENFAEGYIRVCTESPRDGYLCYHPQQPVLSDRRPNKCRVVGDLGHVCRGKSLNSEIHQGPNYTADLVEIVVRFRKYKVAVTGDIKAMYNRVRVPPEQCDLLRFFWWRDGVLDGEIVECQALTHMFGGVWSPAVCMFALKWAAEKQGDGYDQVVIETILRHFYVDDLLRSIWDTDVGIKMITGARELLGKVGFDLIKIGSNDRAILDALPPEARAAQFQELELDMRADTVTHTLGSVWRPVQDLLTFRVVELDKPATRRGVLSTTSSLYDPMGLISPFILKARILLQKICKLKLAWDDPIPAVYNDNWTAWMADVPKIPEIEIPRWIGVVPDAGQHYELHIFVDASSEGYGAAAYLSVMNEEGGVLATNLILSKAKVAPMSPMTIPRLELTAAVLGVKMDRTVRKYLELDIPPTTFWSDSMIVLWYVRGQSWRFKLFVANRVAYLQRHTEVSQWKYVPTELNPADAVSRGLTADELKEKMDWIHGPDFLGDRQDWPTQPDLNVSKERAELKKNDGVCLAGLDMKSCDIRRTLLRSHSNWVTLVRRIAILKKVARYCKSKMYNRQHFSATEIEEAELTAVRLIQEEHLTDKQRKSKIFAKLFPCDDDGLCRVGGRLMMSSLTFEERCPPILPDCEPTRAYIRHVHDKYGHHGIDRTFYDVRKSYWILGGKSTIKKAIGNCVWCKRLRGRPPKQLMSPLPKIRVTPGTAPFESIGVDYFGPLYVRVGRALCKRYGCAITCMQSKAAHIEISVDLSTASFMHALQRFIARRGKPKTIYSDNGSNFIGAKRELKEALAAMNGRYIGDKLAAEGIDWKNNVPLASHHGGVWERLIRSYRCTFHGLVKGQTLTDETLTTFAAMVEQVLNSRPLTRVTEGLDDTEVITPNHLLTLRKAAGISGDFSKGSTVRSKWKQLEYLADIFWRRWTRTYLQELQLRQKWTSPSPDLTVNELVLVVDEHAHRLDWPLGRIVEVYPGRDGHVRSAMIRTKSGCYKRPITKIVRLEGDV